MNKTEILIQAGCSANVVAHSIVVSQLALSFAERATVSLDRELVQLGGLFHDIGRSRTHGIEHALAGVEIAKKLGFSDRLVHIIERHIGAGISEEEAVKLGLPKKDYGPLTPEEKIVSYADNLVSGVKKMPFLEALDRFKIILGPDHEGVELFLKQHHEIQSWIK
ncbi:MAG TPA: HDIG domain-containing protein [Nitrospirota bacterium]|nr:HDIG domain-containing protein [Nitrospirota bacterium]